MFDRTLIGQKAALAKARAEAENPPKEYSYSPVKEVLIGIVVIIIVMGLVFAGLNIW